MEHRPGWVQARRGTAGWPVTPGARGTAPSGPLTEESRTHLTAHQLRRAEQCRPGPAGPREPPDPDVSRPGMQGMSDTHGDSAGKACALRRLLITCVITNRSDTMPHRALNVNTPGQSVDLFLVADVSCGGSPGPFP